MATERYDDEMLGLSQTVMVHIPANTNDAAEEMARFTFYKNVKILNVRALAVSTVFDATDTLQVLNDGTEIGDIDIGNADLTTFADISAITAANALVNATSSLEIQHGTAASPGSCILMVQYQEMFD